MELEVASYNCESRQSVGCLPAPDTIM